MFFSLRLAALTLSALFISHVFGLAIPPVKPFVSFFFPSINVLSFEFDDLITLGLSNFVTVMQDFATVNTETPPFSALMTHSPPAQILSRVRIKMQFFHTGRYSHNKFSVQLQGPKKWV